jgi:3-(3-hydroxy-phenyl)propionate hydroxylase
MSTPTVCVVGAGPVGLTVALGLAQRDIHVVVVERLPAPSTEWRASTFHPPTLELAERLGVVDEMLEQGVIAPTFQIRDWTEGTFAEFDLSGISNETKYPFRLQLEQYKYSDILRDRLDLLDQVDIRYGTSFVSCEERDSGAVVRVSSADGSDEIEADWLVAADGASSTVRGFLGIDFEGMTYPTKAVIVSVDVPLDEWYPDLSYVNYISGSTDHPSGILKIPDVWRVSFSVDDDLDDDVALSDGYIESRLSSVFSDRPAPALIARQIFRVHQRVAATMRLGRVVLVGDAGHINSPKGGMGLNGGIHDAFDLVEVLAAVLEASEDDVALTDWADRRRTVAIEHIQRFTHQFTSEFREGGATAGQGNPVDQYREIAADPERARRYMLDATMLVGVRDQRERLGARL